MLNGLAPTTRSATRKASVALLGVLGVLGVGALAVYAATATSSKAPKPPKPSITTKPARRTAKTSARFRFRDAWSGVTFQCAMDGARFRKCTSPKRYRKGLAGGWHTFRVRALTRGKRHGAHAKYRWWIDGRPVAPRIVGHPAAPTTATSARFAFVGRERGVRFRCRLDAGRWSACKSPVHYRRLRLGLHLLRVRGEDPEGRLSRETRFVWRIATHVPGPDFSIAPAAGDDAFALAGGATLYPGGPAGVIPLTFTNPNGYPIFVTSLDVAITGTPPGCDGDANFDVIQSNVAETNPVEIPAHGSVTLPTQRVAAPRIRFVDRPVNQDACQNATFRFAFNASAHS
jgi:hypothetical protein